jgi:hypothetical protein
MTILGQKTHYIKYNVGDIVREREWIFVSDEPMYGIIISVERHVYSKTEYIPYRDDRVTVFWFKWKHTEMLPATFIEIISKAL